MALPLGIRVLVVDDDPAILAALAGLLAAAGFHPFIAENGASAVALAQQVAPDVVITDLTMPGMDGVELLAELRARHIDAPVIVVTALSDVGAAVRAMRAGVADYLTKPVDGDALVFALHRARSTHALALETRELRARNEELAKEAERNLRIREELLAIVAHDLRNPLATIRLAASPSEGPTGPGDGTRRLAMVERAAVRMQMLVDDLLDLARIETGNLVLEPGSHCASDLLQEVTHTLGPTADQKGVLLDSEVTDEITLRCAFNRLVQALVNLTSNAISVTGRGGCVHLRAGGSPHGIWFQVQDDGPGIAPEALSHIFERGYQGAHCGCRGAGLGLAIAKGIVEAHGGTIRVESTLGSGSTFHVELPTNTTGPTSWRVLPCQAQVGGAS